MERAIKTASMQARSASKQASKQDQPASKHSLSDGHMTMIERHQADQHRRFPAVHVGE